MIGAKESLPDVIRRIIGNGRRHVEIVIDEVHVETRESIFRVEDKLSEMRDSGAIIHHEDDTLEMR